MDLALIIIVGFLSGLLYVQNIYRSSKRAKNPFLTFPIRFFLTALIILLIGEKFGVRGLIIFTFSHLSGVLLFTAYRAFVKP